MRVNKPPDCDMWFHISSAISVLDFQTRIFHMYSCHHIKTDWNSHQLTNHDKMTRVFCNVTNCQWVQVVTFGLSPSSGPWRWDEYTVSKRWSKTEGKRRRVRTKSHNFIPQPRRKPQITHANEFFEILKDKTGSISLVSHSENHKATFTLHHVMNAQRGSRRIALFFL